MSEDVWPFISGMSDPAGKAIEIAENASLGDRELFAIAGDGPSVFLSPLPKVYSFTEILERIHPVLFDKKTKEGVIIVSEHILKQKQLVYIVFGKNKKHALDIEQTMQTLMQ